MCLSHVQLLLNFWFSPVHLSQVDLILRLARRTQESIGECLLSNTLNEPLCSVIIENLDRCGKIRPWRSAQNTPGNFREFQSEAATFAQRWRHKYCFCPEERAWETYQTMPLEPRHRLPTWLSGKEPTCQYRRQGFDPWVGKIPWRRKWQPSPVFLPGKYHGRRSLMGYSPWGCKEWDRAEYARPAP